MWINNDIIEDYLNEINARISKFNLKLIYGCDKNGRNYFIDLIYYLDNDNCLRHNLQFPIDKVGLFNTLFSINMLLEYFNRYITIDMIKKVFNLRGVDEHGTN